MVAVAVPQPYAPPPPVPPVPPVPFVHFAKCNLCQALLQQNTVDTEAHLEWHLVLNLHGPGCAWMKDEENEPCNCGLEAKDKEGKTA
jgi:hypothetical protein